MPTIISIGGLKIQVFADDHFPPHFHVVGPDFEVLVAMSDLSILKGGRYHREVREAMEWARQNSDVLRKEWARLNDER
jgi:hypothetical protein